MCSFTRSKSVETVKLPLVIDRGYDIPLLEGSSIGQVKRGRETPPPQVIFTFTLLSTPEASGFKSVSHIINRDPYEINLDALKCRNRNDED